MLAACRGVLPERMRVQGMVLGKVLETGNEETIKQNNSSGLSKLDLLLFTGPSLVRRKHRGTIP